MDKGLVEDFDEPAMNLCLCGFLTALKTKKVNFLVFQKVYLNFAVFMSMFIKTYILLNLILYYKTVLRRNYLTIIIPYQKYKKTSAGVDYAPLAGERAQVQGQKESRITIRGTSIGALSSLRTFEQVPSYSPQRLVSQIATFWERSVQGCRKTKHNEDI